MKLATISEMKQKLGYSDDTSTTLYIESISGIKGLLGNYAALTDKYYIASIEKDGILFMTLNLMRHFTGASHFLSYAEISNVEFKKSKMINGRLMLNGMKMSIFDNNGGAANYICYTMMAGEKWWKQNIADAQSAISAWPPMKERTAAPTQPVSPTAPADNPAFQTVADQIRDMKSLLDEGIITQEEFDAKKKALLGL